MKVAYAVKKFQDQLDELYPKPGSALVKFYLYALDLDASAAWCDNSNRSRTFISLVNGFRSYCGNQSQCKCNKSAMTALHSSRTPEEQFEINRRRKSTNRKKYGADFASQTQHVKDKTEATNQDKYGTKSPTQNSEVLERVRATNQKNLGVDWSQQSPEVMARSNQTYLKRYGTRRPSQNPKIQEKMKSTTQERFGVDWYGQTVQSREKFRSTGRKKGYQALVNTVTSAKPLFTQDDYLGGTSTTLFTWQCAECSQEFQQTQRGNSPVRCYSCHPRKETWGETAIKSWLQSHNILFEQWNRKIIAPQEFDFWLPELKLGIEFNGIWFHREGNVPSRAYHHLKYRSAKDAGVKLIQVWEHELHRSPAIVFDRLSHACGLSSRKIGARKCTIQRLDRAQALEFFTRTHLQGHANSGSIWGLFDCDKVLVAAASFGPSRYSQTVKWELLRFASAPGTTVVGGMGRLLAHAQKELKFDSLLTYANLNWGNGAVYGALGFEFVNYSNPNYWYFKNIDTIHSRVKFQKHKIIGLAPGSSEREIAKNMGYSRFFDAGNAVWIKRW